MVHVSTMADDYYRFVEKAHLLKGENTGKVFRLGDKVTVQVIRVDMERRQVDLGVAEILERVRESEANRGPRRSRAPEPGVSTGTHKGKHKHRTPRLGKRERAARRQS
jgi:ribonuclease R